MHRTAGCRRPWRHSMHGLVQAAGSMRRAAAGRSIRVVIISGSSSSSRCHRPPFNVRKQQLADTTLLRAWLGGHQSVRCISH